MRVEIIDSIKAFRELRAEWDAVYDADPEAQFFLSWTWMFKWLATLDRRWWVLAARPDGESSAYAAFFPLWLETKERASDGFYNEINIGGNSFADYTGFLCVPAFQEQAIHAFASQIKQLNWTHFRLNGLCASDHRAALFMQEFSEFGVTEPGGLEKDNINLRICPFARLPGDWDAYLNDRLSTNTRQKIRRLLRKVENSDEFRITHAGSDTIGRDIETLLRFWAERWGARKGKRLPDILKAGRSMLRHCFDAGSLFLPVFWQGERPVGALATLVDAGKRSFLFFIGGRDQTFDGPPPGLVLHAHSIRHAIRNGFVTYDFLRGNEPYKYSFGVEERRITYVVLSTKDRKNLGGRLDRSSLPFALKRSMKHHQAGRSIEAEIGFRQVLDIDPHNADALLGLGQIVEARGEHSAAIGLFKTLVATRPDDSKAWYLLGRALQACGELWDAVDAYCEVIERQPKLEVAYYELGHILLELGQFGLAVAAFEAVSALQPDFPDIYASLLKALSSQGAASPESPARHGSFNAKVSDRVGKLSAIAAACDANRPATNKTLLVAREPSSVEPPFLSPAIKRLKG